MCLEDLKIEVNAIRVSIKWTLLCRGRWEQEASSSGGFWSISPQSGDSSCLVCRSPGSLRPGGGFDRLTLKEKMPSRVTYLVSARGSSWSWCLVFCETWWFNVFAGGEPVRLLCAQSKAELAALEATANAAAAEPPCYPSKLPAQFPPSVFL